LLPKPPKLKPVFVADVALFAAAPKPLKPLPKVDVAAGAFAAADLKLKAPAPAAPPNTLAFALLVGGDVEPKPPKTLVDAVGVGLVNVEPKAVVPPPPPKLGASPNADEDEVLLVNPAPKTPVLVAVVDVGMDAPPKIDVVAGALLLPKELPLPPPPKILGAEVAAVPKGLVPVVEPNRPVEGVVLATLAFPKKPVEGLTLLNGPGLDDTVLVLGALPNMPAVGVALLGFDAVVVVVMVVTAPKGLGADVVPELAIPPNILEVGVVIAVVVVVVVVAATAPKGLVGGNVAILVAVPNKPGVGVAGLVVLALEVAPKGLDAGIVFVAFAVVEPNILFVGAAEAVLLKLKPEKALLVVFNAEPNALPVDVAGAAPNGGVTASDSGVLIAVDTGTVLLIKFEAPIEKAVLADCALDVAEVMVFVDGVVD
jgi:hypothetical protein